MNSTEETMKPLFDQLEQARASLTLLFPAPAPESLPGILQKTLLRMEHDLRPAPDFRALLFRKKEADPAPDFVDDLNQLAAFCPEGSLARKLDEACLNVLSAETTPESLRGFDSGEGDLFFLYEHVLRLVRILQTLFRNLTAVEKETEDALSRLRPSAALLHTAQSRFLKLKRPAVALELRKRMPAETPFEKNRIFRYHQGSFSPVELQNIRKPEEFFGFRAARETLQDHIQNFADGKSNLPLLISSLPGLGKTQMTIAYTLRNPALTLILPEPSDLGAGLEPLLRELEQCRQHRFMVFFDDIDPEKTDWYFFRTQVGGTFHLPSNVSLTISSNQAFPANVSSRGRGFEFPMFDELRCQEMVSDFLRGGGIQEPPPELVAVIAADYVEQFGQKSFEELSPRTLVRYLEIYRNNPDQRRRMLELSRGDLVPQPDSQVFYEENLKLMRSIYGEQALDELRKKELHESH